MASEPGLRERKKQQTRQALAQTAQRLFLDRGFDEVTVAEIARAADVSEGTVFNYFPTKEDLFFSGMVSFEEELVAAVRDRPAGEPVLAAFRRVVLDGTRRLETEEARTVIATAARIIGSSRSLQARERELTAGYTDELAALLAAERRSTAGDVEAAAVAAALMGAQRALVAYVHASVLRGVGGRELAQRARSQAKRAFARLEDGLADYGVKRG